MKLYTVKEAAKLVGVSTNTLYKYLDEDRIHAARGSAIQGRFRIPESALEEFLGIKLSSPSEPEPIEQSVGATLPAQAGFTVARDSESEPSVAEPRGQMATGTQENLTAQAGRKTGIPIKLARLLLILALIAVLIDLFISKNVSLPGQLSRLFFLAVMLLLAYQEGGYRRG